MPRRSIRSASASFDITQLLRLNFWNVLSSVAKNSRHPDQFIQKFVETSHITLIEQISLLIEKILHVSKIHVPRPSSRMTGSRPSITRAPPNRPAETPQIPTALL